MKTLIVESDEISLKVTIFEFQETRNQEILGIKDINEAQTIIESSKYDLIIFGETVPLCDCLKLLKICHFNEKSKNQKTPIRSLSRSNQSLQQIHRPNDLLTFCYTKNALKRMQKILDLENQLQKV